MSSIKAMLDNVELKLDKIQYSSNGSEVIPELQEFVRGVKDREVDVPEEQYWAFQYIFRATKK